MSDQKYRQRGYQDDSRPEPKQQARERTPREFRAPNVPGFSDVVRCTQCGHLVGAETQLDSRCEGCGSDLHSCAQCAWFDSSERFECGKPIAARVTPKNVRNQCEQFGARVTVERQTGSTRSPTARSAFDDLFK